MRPHQIEAWTLRLIAAAGAGQPCEDSHAELKTTWPDDPLRAARRIAGLANAAGGEPILWVIGVDEVTGAVPGVSQNDFADWWAQVKSKFESLAPHVRELAVPYGGVTVFALQFDSDRAPFLVRNAAFGQPNGGPVAWEIPWRDGTSVRTAVRADLLRILTAQEPPPEIEVRDAWLNLTSRPSAHLAAWELVLALYIVPRSRVPIVFPFHLCEIEVEGPYGYVFSMDRVVIGGRQSIALGDRGIAFATSQSRTELVLCEPRLVYLTALQNTPLIGGVVGRPAKIEATLRIAGSDLTLTVLTTIPFKNSDNDGEHWAQNALEPKPSDLRPIGKPRSI